MMKPFNWNYRLIWHDTDDHHWIGLHEVHYEDDKIIGWTDPVTFEFTDAVDMMAALRMALEDAERMPALRMSQMPEGVTKFGLIPEGVIAS